MAVIKIKHFEVDENLEKNRGRITALKKMNNQYLIKKSTLKYRHSDSSSDNSAEGEEGLSPDLSNEKKINKDGEEVNSFEHENSKPINDKSIRYNYEHSKEYKDDMIELRYRIYKLMKKELVERHEAHLCGALVLKTISDILMICMEH